MRLSSSLLATLLRGGSSSQSSPGAAGGLTGNLVWVVYADQPNGAYATSGLRYVTTLRDANTDTIEFQYLARETGTLSITLAYAMTADNGGDVELTVQAQKFADGDDPDAALPSGTATAFTPGSGTTRKTVTLTLDVTAGDTGRIVITRSNGGNDTHTGDMRILAVAA